MPASQRLAELIGTQWPEDGRSPRLRLSACRDECGPTLCELTWERSSLGGALARAWLDAGQRKQVEAVVDELETK